MKSNEPQHMTTVLIFITLHTCHFSPSFQSDGPYHKTLYWAFFLCQHMLSWVLEALGASASYFEPCRATSRNDMEAWRRCGAWGIWIVWYVGAALRYLACVIWTIMSIFCCILRRVGVLLETVPVVILQRVGTHPTMRSVFVHKRMQFGVWSLWKYSMKIIGILRKYIL